MLVCFLSFFSTVFLALIAQSIDAVFGNLEQISQMHSSLSAPLDAAVTADGWIFVSTCVFILFRDWKVLPGAP
jgi:hypothetical protein